MEKKYTLREISKACESHGFTKVGKYTFKRCIGDGILQNIYCGFKCGNFISIGIHSIYADLPEWHFADEIPNGTFVPQHFLGQPRHRFPEEFDRQKDMFNLIHYALDAMDDITTQEKLVQLAFDVDAIEQSNLGDRTRSTSLLAPMLMCGMERDAYYVVVNAYVKKIDNFRRTKYNQSLLLCKKNDEYVCRIKELDESIALLSDLFSGLLTNDQGGVLVRYIQNNLLRNLAYLSKYSPDIPLSYLYSI